MNKIFLSSVFAVVSLGASAQSAYDAGNLIQSDLLGSARYVGMGGALNALGGDISVMSSNPAGTGMYRKSDIGISLSGLISGEEAQLGYDRSKASLDQLGVVFAFPVDNSGSGLQFVNIGVNYKKNRNFFGNNFVNVMNLNNTFSQTYQIADLANKNAEFSNGDWGLLADMATPNFNQGYEHDGVIVEDEYGYYDGIGAKDANYRRHTYGSNVEADINLSFNVSDRFYYGLTVGIYDVNYNRESFYEELGVDDTYYDFTNWYYTKGSGVDLKFGFICRPIEESPFRFGIAIHTPTWYRLTDNNGSTLYLNDYYISEGESGVYEYKLRTPWKFNVSLGHTIGKKVALGAEYEYVDYSTAKYSSTNYEDRSYLSDINKECVKKTLKGQHVIKLGAEFKPVDCLSLRLGYNYLSSPYKKDGYREILYFEPFTDTDFTNWGGINRVTCGVGYNWRSGYIDLAYQYQAQKGDFYAFDDIDLKASTIKNNRSQIVATLGFRF